MEGIIITWLFLAAIVATAASRRFERSWFGWFVVALLLSPLLGFLLLWAMGPVKAVAIRK